MSEMEFFRHLRLTRKSFDDTLDLVHKAYGTQSTYREISEMFGVSQTTVFECVQRLIDVLCEAGKDVFLWPTPQIPEIEQEFQQMGGNPGAVGAVLGRRSGASCIRDGELTLRRSVFSPGSPQKASSKTHLWLLALYPPLLTLHSSPML
ncbi:hypothetical protein O3P69_014688 [Scylla paramamosain]|uniref:Transposase n=1 Tax=Scylla paramamosain TaxID=85552 RepID=A0AAW0U0R8_SCYPA